MRPPRAARDDRASAVVRRPQRRPDAPVGVLWTRVDPTRFAHVRYLPAADLAAFVEHVWIVRWDLRGAAPHRQETLPHPSVHLVIERGASGLAGVPHGRFTKVLEGRGRAVGVKFRPGGFRPFWNAPVHTLGGRVLALADAFGDDGAVLEADVLACADADVAPDAAGDRWPGAADVDARIVHRLERFLRERAPREQVPNASLALVTSLVARIVGGASDATLDEIVRACGASARTVQRVFRDHVGVSLKWVLCRQRLHDAASRLASGEPEAWTRFALELGYYDQPHFVRSFTALVGMAPAAYVRRAGGA